MKIKNNILKLGLLSLTTFTLSGCSDFLELEPLDVIVLEKFWNEEGDVEDIVKGCYSAMQEQVVIDRMMAWGEFRSDNIAGGTNVDNDINLSNIFKENINASNAYTSWGEFYDIINRCNTVLYYAPRVAEKDPYYTESELNATRAEVTAIRELMYFYLIRAFHNVPYTTQPYLDDTQNMDQPALPFNDVLDSLILNLESVKDYAVKKYPVTKTYYQRGRITREAIHAMLSEMYLWKGDYQKAVQYADLVIQNKLDEFEERERERSMSTAKLIDGFPLIDDRPTTGNTYGEAYNAIFGSGNSTESIFELVYWNSNTALENKGVAIRYGNSKTYPGYVKASDFVGGDVKDATFEVFRDQYDTRYYENMQASGSSFGINKYVTQSVLVTPASNAVNASYGSLWPENYCHANWIIYRLSDVMLMKAEALTEMINESDSTEMGKAYNDTLASQVMTIVNAVNKRSSCSSSYKEIERPETKRDLQNLVMTERQRELMFEGKRWFDLVRRSLRENSTSYLTQMASRKATANTGASSKLSRIDAIFWPYNIDELKVNSSLVQNPAFGSGENNSYEHTGK